MNTVGGLSAGIDIWELAYLPNLLNNSETWVDIEDSTIEKLENLQLMVYRVILNCPKSTHHAALLWDMGGIYMKLRIIQKKLNFIYHLKNLDNTSLAYQIKRIQENLQAPGLIKECMEYINEFNLPNILKVQMTRLNWKNLVKEAIVKENEKILKKEIKTSKKLKNCLMASENFETRPYISELSLYESRTLFKYRSQMTQYVKMNYKNEQQYSKSLWKCDKCENIDTQSHLLWCPFYQQLRSGKDLKNNKDLCKYLHEIFTDKKKCDEKLKKKDKCGGP